MEQAKKYFDRRRIGISERHEFRFCRTDGSELLAQVNATPKLDDQGEFVSATAIVSDISRQKRMSERIQALEAELARESRFAQMSELLATIADQLNQPLAVAASYAQDLVDQAEERGSRGESAAELARSIHGQVTRASETVRKLRGAIANRTPVRMEVDINEAVREAVSVARRNARSKKVRISTQYGGGLPKVFADEIQIQQAVFGLLENAIDASAARDSKDCSIWTRTEADDDGFVSVVVEDDGSGLDHEAMERMFEAFYSRKSGAMGMGLTVCRSIAELHGGRIVPRNRPEGGAEFRFSIPVGEPGRGRS